MKSEHSFPQRIIHTVVVLLLALLLMVALYPWFNQKLSETPLGDLFLTIVMAHLLVKD